MRCSGPCYPNECCDACHLRLDVADELREVLAEAVECVDAGAADHVPACAQELDNLVIARDEARPLAACDCWVGRARAVLEKARGGQ